MPEMSPDLDLFPANVTTSAGEFKRVRVVVSEGVARIYSEGPKLVSSVEISGPPGKPRHRNAPIELSATDGATWSVQRAGGCGCGSNLRRTPWQGLPT